VWAIVLQSNLGTILALASFMPKSWHASCISKDCAKSGGTLLALAKTVPSMAKLPGNRFTKLFDIFFFIGYISV
jgi:hypothetical protein